MPKNLLKQLVRRAARQSPTIDNFAEVAYYDESDLARWITQKAVFLQRDYMNYPALVHIERLAQCDASCSFCPYVTMERKGTRMPDALIEKIIDDLTAIPRSLRFQVSPYKISDPFLEPSLFDILARINERLPSAAVSLIAHGVPDVPCHRSFDFSITATGRVAMCCMDGKAEYPKGDVNDHHVLEVYNQPFLRKLHETLVSRRITGAPCDRCTYLSYQARVQTTGDDGRRLPADYANCPHLMCWHISVTTQSAIFSSLR